MHTGPLGQAEVKDFAEVLGWRFLARPMATSCSEILEEDVRETL